MNYKIVNVVFNLNILADGYIEKYFKAYETAEEADVKVDFSLASNLIIPKMVPEFTSKTLDLYSLDHLIQIAHGSSESNNDVARLDYYPDACQVVLTNDTLVLQIILIQYIIAYYVCKHNKAIYIHSSCFSYNGNAYLLSAKSGTGKSTHARLWEKYYNVDIINDDKNFVVYENNELYVYGNPLSGKHHKDLNIKQKLKGVVFLKQAKENKIYTLDSTTKIVCLLGQIPVPNPLFAKKDWELVFNQLTSLPFYRLECTISKEAVDTLKGVIDHEIK